MTKSKAQIQEEIYLSLSSKKSLVRVQPGTKTPEEFFHDISLLCLDTTDIGKKAFQAEFYISKKRLKNILSTDHYNYLKKTAINVSHDADHVYYTEYNEYFFDRLFYLDLYKTYIIDDLVMFYNSDIYFSDFANYSSKEKQKLASFWNTYCKHSGTENIADPQLKEFLENIGIIS